MHLNHDSGLPKVWLGKVLETLKFLLTLYANNITFFKTLRHFSYPHTCWMLYITSIRKKINQNSYSYQTVCPDIWMQEEHNL